MWSTYFAQLFNYGETLFFPPHCTGENKRLDFRGNLINGNCFAPSQRFPYLIVELSPIGGYKYGRLPAGGLSILVEFVSKMKLLFVVLIAILGCALAQEEPEPAYLEFGTLADGDVVVDIYYSETTATAELTEHTLNINWEAQDISFVRVSVYYVRLLKVKYF